MKRVTPVQPSSAFPLKKRARQAVFNGVAASSFAFGIVLPTADASPLTLNTLNTSDGSRQSSTSVRLHNVTDDQKGWSGPTLDLDVTLSFPNADPNNRTTPNGSQTKVGVGTGGNPFFSNYTGADPDGDGSFGPGREPFVYTYSFVDDNGAPFEIDSLSIGFTDFDNDGSNFIGREVLVIPGVDSVKTGPGVDASFNDPSDPNDLGRGQDITGRTDVENEPSAVRLDPNLSINGSLTNAAVINFSNVSSFEVLFMNEGFNTGNSGAGLVGGGFGFTGGAELDYVSDNVETSVASTPVPVPPSLPLLGLGLLALVSYVRWKMM